MLNTIAVLIRYGKKYMAKKPQYGDIMELLAPVGNIPALYAAINSGADAVYLGLDCFNARAKAVGFTRENIGEYIDLCHLYGVKVYIAFNTAVKQRELENLDSYVSACTKADAFITADMGALEVFYKYNVPLHASTQMGVNNLEGALFLQEKGFSRVVVARETAKEDIIAIKKNTNLEVEYFVHGALCVSYSGSCLLSSMMSGDSGNRGRCNQPCRLPYKSTLSSKEGYLLSPSEQCLITKLNQLKELGIDSLKIEGRLKKPHYVSTVVSQYRKVLDGAKADEKAVNELKKAFNRGEFTSGYIFDDTKSIMSPKVQSNIGVTVGTVLRCDKNGVTVKASQELRDGDGLKILYKGKELGGFGVKILKSDKNVYLLQYKGDFPAGADVRRTLDYQSADEEITLKKKGIKLCAEVSDDFTVKVTAQKGSTVFSLSAKSERATGRPLTEDDFSSCLSKLGDTPFYTKEVFVNLNGNGIFMPKSMLNALRRETVQGLKNALVAEYEQNMSRCDYSNKCKSDICKNRVSERKIIVNTDDVDTMRKFSGKNIIISYQIYDFSHFLSQIDIFLGLIENNFSVYLHLPPVVRGGEMRLVEDVLQKCKDKIDGLICENYYTVYLAKKYGLKSIAGIRLNVYNAGFEKVAGVDNVIYSPELTLREIDDINSDGYVYAYGILPVMTLCHCPVQISAGCDCGSCKYSGDFYYSDKKADYLVKRTKIMHCYFELHNAAIVDISAKADKIRYNLYINMVNCNRTPEDVTRSVTDGGEAQGGSNCAHLFRGVK